MKLFKSKVKWTAAGIAVSGERTHTWLALAGVDESRRVVIDLQDSLPGTSPVGQVLEAWTKHGIDLIGIFPHSPSATLVEPLAAEGLPLKLADALGMAVAHGIFQDLITEKRIRLEGNRALDKAAQKASERKLAGAHALDPYSGVDLSALNAAELAAWALGDPDEAEGLAPDQVTAQWI